MERESEEVRVLQKVGIKIGQLTPMNSENIPLQITSTS